MEREQEEQFKQFIRFMRRHEAKPLVVSLGMLAEPEGDQIDLIELADALNEVIGARDTEPPASGPGPLRDSMAVTNGEDHA